MNKNKYIYAVVIIALALAGYFFFGHSSDVASNSEKIKCPEQYAENEFNLYLEDAEKWMKETQAKNPEMTEEQLYEIRTQALISSGCRGQGEDDTQLKESDADSRPISAEELEELKKDPSAPEWMKDAESCRWIGERVFCKTKEE